LPSVSPLSFSLPENKELLDIIQDKVIKRQRKEEI
jgi:hypothetical protein